MLQTGFIFIFSSYNSTILVMLRFSVMVLKKKSCVCIFFVILVYFSGAKGRRIRTKVKTRYNQILTASRPIAQRPTITGPRRVQNRRPQADPILLDFLNVSTNAIKVKYFKQNSVHKGHDWNFTSLKIGLTNLD